MHNDMNPGQTPGGKNMTNVLLACCAVLLAAILIMLGVMFTSNRSSTASGAAATQPAQTSVQQETAGDAAGSGKDAEASAASENAQDGAKQTAEDAEGTASQSGKDAKEAAEATDKKESTSKDAEGKKDASGVASASESKNGDDKQAPKQSEEKGQSSATKLPRRWYGEYVGVFAYADGTEYTTTRRSMLVLDESYVDGPVTGVMYLDYGSEGEESYYVEGYYDGSSRELEVWWTEWIERKGTQSTREFIGVVSRDYTTMDGETVTTQGEHWSNWDSYAE